MYNYFNGILIKKEPTLAVLECSSIGYNIHIPISTYNMLPDLGQKTKLFTYFDVKENSLKLYGFISPEDKLIFTQILSVSGIGPKAGLAILSTLSVDEFMDAVMCENIKPIVKTPGIGPKSAKKLVIDLKDKLGKLKLIQKAEGQTTPTIDMDNSSEQAIKALVSLGYQKSAAEKAVMKASKDVDEKTVENLIKKALKMI